MQDVWDVVLSFGGPLALASDVPYVAAWRIQRRWRGFCRVHPVLHPWAHGQTVLVPRHFAGEVGTLLWMGNCWCVRRRVRKHSYLWMDVRHACHLRVAAAPQQRGATP